MKDLKSIEMELLKMAGSIDVETDILAAFADMEKVDALNAIQARLRETRSILHVMEDMIYFAKKAAREEAVRS